MIAKNFLIEVNPEEDIKSLVPFVSKLIYYAFVLGRMGVTDSIAVA